MAPKARAPAPPPKSKEEAEIDLEASRATVLGLTAYKPDAPGDDDERTEKKQIAGPRKSGAQPVVVEASKQRRAQLIVAAVVGVVVIGVLVAALAKGGDKPSRETLEQVWAKSFGARTPEPNPSELGFELADESPCPTHRVNVCLTYNLTGAKYPITMVIYKSRDGWLVESASRH